ncbi:hypothetical protein BU15DRAFT_63187 [Melanogaster broomeanus]|nr:hypothetical protein BU15DRAFT_63187 [Melanogaster broomeanus]
MAVKTYTWVTLWFLLTAPVMFWDAGYCLMRPRSMVGGDLHWIWEGYEIYQEIDYLYGPKALEENNGFTGAQALLNLIETLTNLSYVYLAHVSGWSAAPVVGFAAATMTFWKTALYWLQEVYCGGCAVGHNTFKDLFVFYIFPNMLWTLIPCAIMLRLGKDIAGAVIAVERSSKKAASGKSF